MSESAHLRLVVITGSTRKGRFGPTVTAWIADEARKRGDLEVETIDLAEADLPTVLPDFTESDPAQVKALGARLAQADAFVVVTPEYNHAPPASLKNAIDWYMQEWMTKPVGFVSYGGMSGGTRAVEHLRQIFAEVHATTVRDVVSFHNYWERFDESDQPVERESCNAAAKGLLDQLTWWATALRDYRIVRPYAS